MTESEVTQLAAEHVALVARLEKAKRVNAELLAALQAFVTAEETWAKEKAGMPAGTFDDPLDEAYKQARAAIAKANR